MNNVKNFRSFLFLSIHVSSMLWLSLENCVATFLGAGMNSDSHCCGMWCFCGALPPNVEKGMWGYPPGNSRIEHMVDMVIASAHVASVLLSYTSGISNKYMFFFFHCILDVSYSISCVFVFDPKWYFLISLPIPQFSVSDLLHCALTRSLLVILFRSGTTSPPQFLNSSFCNI